MPSREYHPWVLLFLFCSFGFCCGSSPLRCLFRGLSGVGRTSSRGSFLMSGPQPLIFPEVNYNQTIISVRSPQPLTFQKIKNNQSLTEFPGPRQRHSQNSPAPGGDEARFSPAPSEIAWGTKKKTDVPSGDEDASLLLSPRISSKEKIV